MMRSTIGVLILSSMLIVGTHGALDAKTNDPQAMAFHQADVGAALEKGWTVLTVELPPDTANSWHSQPQGEFLYVLEGAGRLEVDGKRAVALGPGSVATLTSVPRHVLKNPSRTKILKILVVFLEDKREPHPLRTTGAASSLQEDGNAFKEGSKLRMEQKSPDIGLVF